MESKLKGIEPTETSVLIVDDSQQYATVLKKILGSVFGYTDVTTVNSTEQAYDLVSSEPQRFKLMFVDYNFPTGQSGGELLKQLAASDLLREKAAFLITSEPTVDIVKSALTAGALGVVAKPFDRSELGKQLEHAARAVMLDKNESF